MKYVFYLFYLLIFALLVILFTLPRNTQADKVISPVATTTVVARETSQDEWIDSLAVCESGNYAYAINPKDSDGTPSYGMFQFKTGTYLWLLGKYEIQSAPIFSSTTQRAIVKRMINDPDIKIANQFPDCIKNHIGLPPKALD